MLAQSALGCPHQQPAPIPSTPAFPAEGALELLRLRGWRRRRRRRRRCGGPPHLPWPGGSQTWVGPVVVTGGERRHGRWCHKGHRRRREPSPSRAVAAIECATRAGADDVVVVGETDLGHQATRVWPIHLGSTATLEAAGNQGGHASTARASSCSRVDARACPRQRPLRGHTCADPTGCRRAWWWRWW